MIAIKNADIKGNIDSILNNEDPGLTIIKTPIKPINIAKTRCHPNFSPNTGTAKNAAIIGAE